MIIRSCAALAIVLSSVPLFALESPLAIFPSETSAVIRSASPAVLSNKAKAFLEQAAPQFAPVADRIGPAMGSLIENPTLKGVDAERDWFLAIMLLADEDPRLVFAIPTSDAEAMRMALGEAIHSKAYEGWLVYSQSQEAIEALPAEPLADEKSIKAAMDEAAAKLFGAGELALFVNLPAVRKTYQKQIDELKQEIADGLEESSELDNPRALAGLKFGQKMLEKALEVLGDSTGLAIHVALQEEAIVSEAVFTVKPDSQTAKYLAGESAPELSLLEKLPAGSLAYFDVAGGLNEVVELSSEMFMKLPDVNEDAQKALEKLATYDFQESAMAFEITNSKQGVYEAVGFTRLESAEDYLESLRAWGKAMAHFESNGFQQDIIWQPEAELIEGVKVDLVRTVITISPQADSAGNLNEIMKLLFGEEGLTQRIAVVGDIVVQSVGGGKEQMAQAIRAAKGASETDASAAAALTDLRKELGGEGQMLLVYDLPRIAAAFLELTIESGIAPLPPEMAAAIADLELAPSYGGSQMSIKENRVHFREVLPAEQIEGLVKLGTAVRNAARGDQ